METASQTEEKKTRKYRLVKRAIQTKVLDESKHVSQRTLAKKHDIPRTTLQYWQYRKDGLVGKLDPDVVHFFESPSGQAWLHEMVIATFLIFHQNGNSG